MPYPLPNRDVWSERLPDGRTVWDATRDALKRPQVPQIAQIDYSQRPPEQPAIAPPADLSTAATDALQPADARVNRLGALLPQSSPELQEVLKRRQEVESLPEVNPAKGQPHHIGRWGGFRRGIATGLQEAASLGLRGPDALAYGLGKGAGGAFDRNEMLKQERAGKLSEVNREVGQQLGIEKAQADIQEQLSQAAYRALGPQRNPVFQTRVVGEGEYDGVPAGTAIRQEYNQQTGKLEDVVDKGKPVVVREPRAGSSTPHESTRVVREGEYENVPAGTAIRTLWNGKEYVDQLREDKPLIATLVAGDKPSEVAYSNQQIRQQIEDLKAEQSKIDEYLGKTPLTTQQEERNVLGDVTGKKDVPTPGRAEQQARKNKIADDIKELQRKLKPEPVTSKQGLTIEGAISRFKEVHKRDPNAQEIANMKAALGQ